MSMGWEPKYTEKSKKSTERWRIKNREHYLNYTREYYKKNKERINGLRKNHRDGEQVELKTRKPLQLENHPSWKGGVITRKDGYMYEIRHGHPRANNGYVRQHILVWEDYYNKLL